MLLKKFTAKQEKRTKDVKNVTDYLKKSY